MPTNAYDDDNDDVQFFEIFNLFIKAHYDCVLKINHLSAEHSTWEADNDVEKQITIFFFFKQFFFFKYFSNGSLTWREGCVNRSDRQTQLNEFEENHWLCSGNCCFPFGKIRTRFSGWEEENAVDWVKYMCFFVSIQKCGRRFLRPEFARML
jgi:hypothetical protein